MGDTSWKQVERDVGRYFGTMRQVGSGSLGRQDRSRSDVQHPGIFIEAKRRKIYNPLARTLAELRKDATHFERKGCLVFPQPDGSRLIAIHSDDLLPVVTSCYDSRMTFPEWYTNTSLESVEWDIPTRLGKNFTTYDEAKEMSRAESLPYTILAIRAPRQRGFIILGPLDELVQIAAWHVSGIRLVRSRGGGLDKTEIRDADTYYELWQREPQLKTLLDNTEGILKKYGHSWIPPKPKKRRVAKPKLTEGLITALEGTAGPSANGERPDVRPDCGCSDGGRKVDSQCCSGQSSAGCTCRGAEQVHAAVPGCRCADRQA